jgi:DNA replication and repair protein RecF
MPIGELCLQSFRCFESGEISLKGEPAILVGPNGSGKTSLLEAVYLLARGRSFRTSRLSVLVRKDCHSFGVESVVLLSAGSRIIKSVFENGLRTFIDGREATAREIGQLFPLTLMDSDVTRIVLGGPERRRRLLDWLMFHVEPENWATWKFYRRALLQWQWALRSGMSGDIWYSQMMEVAPGIEESRKRLLAGCLPFWELAASVFFPGQVFSFDYCKGRDSHGRLDPSRPDVFRADSVSPSLQRAEVEIRVDQIPVRQFFSRGQAKLLALALIWGGSRFLAQKRETCPVLLLDDFSSELDEEAQGRLLRLVQGSGIQVVMTASSLSRASLESWPHGLFHVEQGHVRAIRSC